MSALIKTIFLVVALSHFSLLTNQTSKRWYHSNEVSISTPDLDIKTPSNKSENTVFDHYETANNTTLILFSVSIVIILCLIVFFLQQRNKWITTVKEKAELFSYLIAELQRPITAIIDLGELIAQEKNETQQDNYITNLKLSAKQMAIVVDNVKQANSHKHSDKQLNKQVIQLLDFLNNLEESVSFFAEKHNVNFKIDISIKKPDLNIFFNVKGLNQVLINLIYTAIKRTAIGKNVVLKVTEFDRTDTRLDVFFEIIDQGTCLPKSFNINHLEPLSKTSLSSTNQSTAFGLKMSKKLLQSFNSKLECSSELGKGASFFFNIELEIDKTAFLSENTNFDVNTKGLENLRILIVDDNKINTIVTKKSLVKLGANSCDIAHGGIQAINKSRIKTYDLLIIDLEMPDLDGYQTANVIKSLHPSIYVIALAALKLNESKSDLNGHNMDDVIIKPYTFFDLKTTIGTYLNEENKKGLINSTYH